MKNTLKIVLVGTTLITAAVIAWRLLEPRQIPSATHRVIPAKPAPITAVVSVPSEPTPAAPMPAVVRAEITGTDRMIVAHNSLRAPEVANPDSATNRRILETMIEKALRANSTPPQATPH